MSPGVMSIHYICKLLLCPALVVVAMLTAGSAQSCPPHPDLIRSHITARAAGFAVAPLPDPEELHAMGICTPDDFSLADLNTSARARGQAPQTGVFRVLALLVDFADQPALVTPTFFDTLVFGSGPNTIRHYFDEISYSQIDLVTVNLPSSVGWTRSAQTYAYYVDNQYGIYGNYPHNSQKLVEDLVDAVDGTIDFSVYDNDDDGFVDILLVIHSGTGAELSGQSSDMWSHKWAIAPRQKDGVYLKSYTVQPEFWHSPGDMTIGVYAHELCHGFGLPDLYDVDGSSNGIGNWGLMSYGAWNGTLGDSPAHPCAWSRIQMGMASAINITSDVVNQAITDVNSGGSIYRFSISGPNGDEYFLIENRQQTGYDNGLPGSGLLIWHIDDSKQNNDEEWYPGLSASNHFLVALEQADGQFHLEHRSGYGGSSDPFPGSLSRTSFSSSTTPSSDSYLDGLTLVALENISPSASIMYADITVGIAANVQDEDTPLPGQFTLEQNYPNPFNPNTNIEFILNQRSEAKLDIYNLLGQHVKTLLDGAFKEGFTTVVWDATDAAGRKVSSGIYLYKLMVAGSQSSKKMLLIK